MQYEIGEAVSLLLGIDVRICDEHVAVRQAIINS
jgi:hypothetical protein